MTQSINQPPFWLSVRKEYVVDNFDSLIDYARDYMQSTLKALPS